MIKQGTEYNLEFTVNSEVYNGFINIFKDNNPLHTDLEFAQGKGFSSKVMHGNILNGFVSYFIGECLPIKNVIIHSQNIKFIKPVYLNDKLNFCAKINEVFESVKAVEISFIFENNQKIKVAKGNIQIGVL